MSRFRVLEDHRNIHDAKWRRRSAEESRSGFYECCTSLVSMRRIAVRVLFELIVTIHVDLRRTYGGHASTVSSRAGVSDSNAIGSLDWCGPMGWSGCARGAFGVEADRKSRQHPICSSAISPCLDQTSSGLLASPSSSPTKTSSTSPASATCSTGACSDGQWTSARDAEVGVEALVTALGRTTPDPDGLIHHADRGSQYISPALNLNASLHGLRVSFDSIGGCSEIAAMGTFWSPTNREIRWARGSDRFGTRAEARLFLFEWSEVFYCRQRHPAGLGHSASSELAATSTLSRLRVRRNGSRSAAMSVLRRPSSTGK